jgi:hypothetical protein
MFKGRVQQRVARIKVVLKHPHQLRANTSGRSRQIFAAEEEVAFEKEAFTRN